jgi:hypothetical protein
MDKNELMRQFDDMIYNSDFLYSEENRDELQIMLTNWQRELNMKCDEVDRKRADEELARVQPQLDVINKVFDEVATIMFSADFRDGKVTSGTVSGRFSSNKPNMKEIEKSMFKITKENVHFKDTTEESEGWNLTNANYNAKEIVEEIDEALRNLAKWENQ